MWGKTSQVPRLTSQVGRGTWLANEWSKNVVNGERWITLIDVEINEHPHCLTTSSNTRLIYFTYFDKSDFKNVNAGTQQLGKRPWHSASNSRLRRSRSTRRKEGGGAQKNLGPIRPRHLRLNPIKARIHVGPSKKSVRISCNTAQDWNWQHYKICKFKSLQKYLLQECFPIKTEADYNEVSET